MRCEAPSTPKRANRFSRSGEYPLTVVCVGRPRVAVCPTRGRRVDQNPIRWVSIPTSDAGCPYGIFRGLTRFGSA